MLDVDEDDRRRLLATLHEAEIRATKAREIEVAARKKGQEGGAARSPVCRPNPPSTGGWTSASKRPILLIRPN